jgi:hypothetical protein
MLADQPLGGEREVHRLQRRAVRIDLVQIEQPALLLAIAVVCPLQLQEAARLVLPAGAGQEPLLVRRGRR